MEIKSIKDVLDYIDYGINNNNCNSNYRVYMQLIHKFLHNSKEINIDYLFPLLEQTNLIILKLFTHENDKLKIDYYKMTCLIFQSLEKNNEE